ncbi:MAG: translation elongation factor 4 [Armatimonadota bacterium]
MSQISQDIPQERIRNFCIVAHIDHGKSTLADRLLEFCHVIEGHDMRAQVLDSMDLERERGITIKASAVRLTYEAKDGLTYLLNLIDTPGHVDFGYEVSRALHACEGAVLLVDVSQGVEAQTVANVYLAVNEGLEIIPAINKVDLANFDPDLALGEMDKLFGFERETVLYTSGKSGAGVPELLEAIVQRVPPPKGDPKGPLKALIFDSKFDTHRGAYAYMRVFEGSVKPGDEITMMANGNSFLVTEVGVFSPQMQPIKELRAGHVGYLAANIKTVADCRVGDTITSTKNKAPEALPGYREPQPMVFCGLYPAENADYQNLKDALEKFSLNDAALHYEPETSAALGFGFRCGFLGLLHMEIVQERLEREYNLDLVATAPSVVYQVMTRKGDLLEIDNPAKFPTPDVIEEILEPIVTATIMTPHKYVGPLMQISEDRRGVFGEMEYLYADRVALHYRLPLAEIVIDYFDQLKSVSRGYATLDYEVSAFEPGDLVKVDIMINGEPVDALAIITHRQFAERRGRQICQKLKTAIPKQMFEVKMQAAIGGRIVASTRNSALRKNVIEKCYGGDISRKRKLLEKQKEGKKRMKSVGVVEVPQEAFMSILRLD